MEAEGEPTDPPSTGDASGLKTTLTTMVVMGIVGRIYVNEAYSTSTY